MFVVVFLLGMLLGASVVVDRTLNFLNAVTGRGPGSVVDIVHNAVQPPPGSLAYKLQNNQQINILILGVGGAENDAPTLSDTIMAVTIDPQSKRIVETSVPRDLWVSMSAWTDGRTYANKINVANEIGSDDSYSIFPCCKKPENTGRDGGGHFAEATVGQVTGLKFDRYVTVDFKAFRDIVDALGGVDINLDTPLDDCHYPDYHNGYMNGGVDTRYPCPNKTAGIHFAAGPQHVDGEKALELARSRDASEPEQATDFARAKRQQMIVQAVRKKAMSLNAIAKLPDLMNAVQKNVKTDMDVNDIQALYEWSSKLPDSSFVKIALTNTDLLASFYAERGGCGDPSAWLLCPEDPTYRYIHSYLAHDLIDPQVAGEQAPIQFINATTSSSDIDARVTNSLRPFGFHLVDPVPGRLPPADHTRIIDYSNGQYQQTASWLSTYFGAPVETPDTASGSGVLLRGQITNGLVVVLGHDFGLRFYGLQP
jgi:LCP family protein required for cell wall assembly